MFRTALCGSRHTGSRVISQHTDFHFVTAWHATAERAANDLQRGDRLFVEGRIETYAMTRDGVRQERIRLVATRVLALHARRRNPAAETPTGPEHIGALIDEESNAAEVREPVEEGA